MPFAAEFEPVHKAIRDALNGESLEPTRADDLFSTRAGLEKILRGIGEAEVVIADMTGRNANVFYEVGIAHMVKENVVLLAQSIRDDLPFDLQHIDHLQYSPTADGLNELTRGLRDILRKLEAEPLAPTIRAEPLEPLPARITAGQLTDKAIRAWESEAPGMVDDCNQRFGARLTDAQVAEAAGIYLARFLEPWEEVEALGMAAILQGDSARVREILPVLGRAYSSSDSWIINNRLIRGQTQLIVLRTWSLWGALAVHLEQWECVNILLTSTVEFRRRSETEFSSFPEYRPLTHPEGAGEFSTIAARIVRQSIETDAAIAHFGDREAVHRAYACFLFGSAILSVGNPAHQQDPHFPTRAMIEQRELQSLMRRLDQDTDYAVAFVAAVTGETLDEFNPDWGAGLSERLSTYGMKEALGLFADPPQLPETFGR